MCRWTYYACCKGIAQPEYCDAYDTATGFCSDAYASYASLDDLHPECAAKQAHIQSTLNIYRVEHAKYDKLLSTYEQSMRTTEREYGTVYSYQTRARDQIIADQASVKSKWDTLLEEYKDEFGDDVLAANKADNDRFAERKRLEYSAGFRARRR